LLGVRGRDEPVVDRAELVLPLALIQLSDNLDLDLVFNDVQVLLLILQAKDVDFVLYHAGGQYLVTAQLHHVEEHGRGLESLQAGLAVNAPNLHDAVRGGAHELVFLDFQQALYCVFVSEQAVVHDIVLLRLAFYVKYVNGVVNSSAGHKGVADLLQTVHRAIAVIISRGALDEFLLILGTNFRCHDFLLDDQRVRARADYLFVVRQDEEGVDSDHFAGVLDGLRDGLAFILQVIPQDND